jgi:hypothetical protein
MRSRQIYHHVRNKIVQWLLFIERYFCFWNQNLFRCISLIYVEYLFLLSSLSLFLSLCLRFFVLQPISSFFTFLMLFLLLFSSSFFPPSYLCSFVLTCSPSHSPTSFLLRPPLFHPFPSFSRLLFLTLHSSSFSHPPPFFFFFFLPFPSSSSCHPPFFLPSPTHPSFALLPPLLPPLPLR